MESVYLVQHCYEINNVDEIKLIGVFTSENIAKEAIDKVKLKPGFKNFPEDSFSISKLKLNDCFWQEGFIDWEEENS